MMKSLSIPNNMEKKKYIFTIIYVHIYDTHMHTHIDVYYNNIYELNIGQERVL